MTLQEVLEVRLGRNFIRKGDVVRLAPSKPGKRDGGEATVEKIMETTEGYEFHTILTGGRGFKVVRQDRIHRVQQVRGGERRKAR